MSLHLHRAALLARRAPDTAPPAPALSPWTLDPDRLPQGLTPGLTLSPDLQAVHAPAAIGPLTAWLPTARAIAPWDGPRYWEVQLSPDGPDPSPGFIGIATEALHAAWATGRHPGSLGALAWAGEGSLWSDPGPNPALLLSGLPGFGPGDVLMCLLDPAEARLWLGRNGAWIAAPSAAPLWQGLPHHAGGSRSFHPLLQPRGAGEGQRLRSTQAQFSYPPPPGSLPLATPREALLVHLLEAHLELGHDPVLLTALATAWVELGGGSGSGTGDGTGSGAPLTTALLAAWAELGTGPALSLADLTLWIERSPP